ncbi:hypothetical protein RIF29_28983 [Crotalaria pallida]|uniref:Uncharacterized protein n=1 Tax=Crotalaria pallida TaxID=3830 RepID=A0AAN9EIW9_CROPI
MEHSHRLHCWANCHRLLPSTIRHHPLSLSSPSRDLRPIEALARAAAAVPCSFYLWKLRRRHRRRYQPHPLCVQQPKTASPPPPCAGDVRHWFEQNRLLVVLHRSSPLWMLPWY